MSPSSRPQSPAGAPPGRNNGQVIPTLSRPDPEDIVAKHGAVGERFVALLRDSASDTVRRGAALPDPGRAGAGRLGPAGAFARPHQDRRTSRAAMVEIRRAGRIAVARAGPRHAGLGCLVRRLLEQDRRPHQSAGAGARAGARRARSRRRAFTRARRRSSFERRDDRWVVKTEKGEISGRALIVATNAYSGEFSKSLVPDIAHEVMPVLSWQMATQPLSDNVRKTIIPGRQAMSDTHGELYFARYDARNRLVTGGAVIGPGNKVERIKARVDRAAAAAVAADRRRLLRLCLERLCRHDHGLSAAHPSSRAERLWLDRLQRPRGRAVDPARPTNCRRRCGACRKASWRCRSRSRCRIVAHGLLRKTRAADADALPARDAGADKGDRLSCDGRVFPRLAPLRSGDRRARTSRSDHLPSRLRANSPPGIEFEQRLRIGVLRIAEHLAREPLLHHFTVLHHGDEIADLRGDAQIMRDEDDGEAEPLAQLREQLQHLRLHGNIERRDRLVGDQHVRLQRQRAREPDALPLAAGEFMRKAVARRKDRARPARTIPWHPRSPRPAACRARSGPAPPVRPPCGAD